MATELVVGGYTKKNNEVSATVQIRTEGRLDLVLTADGNKSMLDLIKDACSEVVAKQPPGAPVPPEWQRLLTVPAAGKQVAVVLGLRAETTPAV